MKMIQRAWRMKLARYKFVEGHFAILPIPLSRSWSRNGKFSKAGTHNGSEHAFSWGPIRSSPIGLVETSGPGFIHWDMSWDTESIVLHRDPLMRTFVI